MKEERLAASSRPPPRSPIRPAALASLAGLATANASQPRAPSRKFDLSLVLNLHDETRYLARTLTSLEEAVAYARHLGLSFELVVVLDRPHPSTAEWIGRYDFRCFDGHKVIVVDNGSPGSSRNDGALAASGEYIAFCDGDDLVSYNMFAELYLLVWQRGSSTIGVPEFMYAFGDRRHIWRHFDLNVVSTLRFFNSHPYTSRIICHHTVFETTRNSDTPIGGRYAHEDWHFNCEALASGYKFEIAKNTIIFYRQRTGSMMKNHKGTGASIIPPSRFFEPKVYLSVCADDYPPTRMFGQTPPSEAVVRRQFTSSDVLLELLHAANRIDPAINLASLDAVPASSSLSASVQPGAAYFEACRIVGSGPYTDVVLLPFLTTGGADKYVIDILNGLASLYPERRFLVLAGQRFGEHSWVEKLPSRSVFLDLHRICAGCKPEAIDSITLRLIQAVAPNALIHIKPCVYAQAFCRNYGSLLERNKFLFYHFCENIHVTRGLTFTEGYNFNFISEFSPWLSYVISDHGALLADTREYLELDGARLETVYARCEPPAPEQVVRPAPGSPPQRKLLWASRLDRQKRPDLLLKIADKLRRRLPDVQFDVYGSAILDAFDVAQLEKLPNVAYKGPFSSFYDLGLGSYDAFIYTASFDGLPNIVLEAMAADLLVVAPDVGGIREAVTQGTGLLIANSNDDEVLVANYVAAIEKLYSSWSDFDRVRREARAYIERRHSEEALLARLKSIFSGVEKRGERAAQPVKAELEG